MIPSTASHTVPSAPSNAVAGPYGKGEGAVSWLLLSSNDSPDWNGGVCDFKAVYQLNTAGGNPPKMCTGQAASFEVQYAAEYWFFK